MDITSLYRAEELQSEIDILNTEFQFIALDLTRTYAIHQLGYRQYDYNQYSDEILTVVSSSLSSSLNYWNNEYDYIITTPEYQTNRRELNNYYDTIIDDINIESEFITTNLCRRYPIHQLSYRKYDYNQYSIPILDAISGSMYIQLQDLYTELNSLNYCDYILTDITLTNPIDTSKDSYLELTIHNKSGNYLTSYLYINWNVGGNTQIFNLSEEYNTITSTQYIPIEITDFFVINITGAIELDVPISIKDWVLQSGYWDNLGHWFNDSSWKL